MNGEVPSVPITTLAGLASLTHLLPELPLPTPLNQYGSGSILLHPGLEDSARHILQSPDHGLASRVAQALQAQPAEFLAPATAGATPTALALPLAQAVHQHNPQAFGQCQVQAASYPHHQNNHNTGEVMMNGNSGGNVEEKSALRQVRRPSQVHEGNGGYRIPKVQNDSPVKVNNEVTKNFGIKMSKLSREDEKLMQRSLSDLKVTSYNNIHSSPRMQRKTQESKYKDRSDSESSEDEDGAPKKKSKFFKHTENERNQERESRKADRRRRREDEDDYNPEADMRKRRHSDSDDDDSSWLKKRKMEEDNNVPSPPDMANFVPKKVTKKIERKLLPMQRKMDAEELMESNNFKRFSRTIEAIFDAVEEVNMAELGEMEDDTQIPSELLVPKYQAGELASEAAKLKSLQAMEQVPVDRLVKLLGILSWNIKDGSNVIPIPQGGDDDEERDDDALFLELVWDRVNRAADCAVCAMHVMTSKNMKKRVFMDDVIDRIAQFVRFHLQNTVYPSFDPVYKEMSKNKDGYIGSMKKKRTYAPSVKDRKILNIYNKCTELVGMLADLLQILTLTDTTVLHLSTMGVAPFFVENIPELQLSSLRMVTGVFSKYDKHRKLVLDDILASIARLPQTKRSLRTYRLNRNENVQMLTALVMQLIQCVAVLPEKLAKGKGKDKKSKKEKEEDDVKNPDDDSEELVVDRDVLVNNNYESAMATAYQFLTVFLKKCGSKSEDVDYRPLFENFLQDLLTTVNTPEWPAAELLLSLLGKLLVSKFANKGTEVSLRISSLDYLGVVAARLRRDAVQSRLKIDTIDAIIETVKEAEDEAGEEVEEDEELEEEEKRTRFLQRVLLDYLAVNGGEDDPQTASSRHFYISQWYRDSDAEIRKNSNKSKPRKKDKPEKSRRRGRRGRDSDSESSDDDDDEDDEEEKEETPVMNAEVYRLTEARKEYLVSKICPFGPTSKRSTTLASHIDSTAACLIVKYLSAKRPFFNSFDFYLKQILNVLTEQSIQVRSKALKCMALVVQEDPGVLSRDDMQRGVNYSFLDAATMVREAAVDLVGKFILHRAELIDKYYEMLLLRILDTGVSVRKRVIKILKDICLEFPDYPKIPEICVKMIRRINDEEGIRKLVMDVFQNMWFQPMSERRRSEKEEHLLVTKAENITDVVVACRDTGLEWFEQLLQTLFRPKEDKDDATKVNKEPPRTLLVACQQIVDCLIETVLKSEETTIRESETAGSSHRIVACLTTTFLFAKSRPQLLINHVQTLQPYLNVRCKTQGDYQIISHVARTLELTVPLIEHPSEIFLSQLEEASMKLILLHDKTVVSACLSCLGSVVNNVTRNFTLIRDCFKKYFGHLVSFKKVHSNDPQDQRLEKATPFFRRSLFTVGLLLRYFDFGKEELYAGLEWGSETKNAVFDALYYFLDHENVHIQNATLQALGYVCIRHYDFMMDDRLKLRYISILTKGVSSTQTTTQTDTAHVLQVLNNIETYLVEEEIRMMQLDKNWKEYAEKENLKEMGDVTSGMASTVIQIFLQSILDSFIHPSVQVRHAALKVIQLILGQGLVHPVQIVPYLICMSTDHEQRVSHTADKELQDIEKKYPGFIHMKLMKGIMLSFRLQQLLQKSDGGPLRGFRQKEGELPGALNGFLYSCLRSTKSQRRAILMNLLKQFDDTSRNSLPMMLYLADNLAYIPYTVVDEPLFLIHHIDIMVSVIGCNILQSIKESLQLPAEYEVKMNMETGREEVVYDEDLDEDKNSVFSRLPHDMTGFLENITTAQGCLLLLVLREHLKEFYGINESKISGYSPSESQKIYERAVTRRAGAKFNPKAVVEILKQGKINPATMDDEKKRETVENYIAFKSLMFKIDKDEDEYDDDGNLIPNHPQVSAKELQNLGMPSAGSRANHGDYNTRGTNGYSAPPNPNPSSLPPAMRGMNPTQFNPVIRLQNVPLSSLPGHQLPDSVASRPSRESARTSSSSVTKIPDTGGYLDPETGDWVSTNSVINSEEENSRHSHSSSRASKNTQVGKSGGKSERLKERARQWDLAKAIYGDDKAKAKKATNTPSKKPSTNPKRASETPSKTTSKIANPEPLRERRSSRVERVDYSKMCNLADEQGTSSQECSQ